MLGEIAGVGIYQSKGKKGEGICPRKSLFTMALQTDYNK